MKKQKIIFWTTTAIFSLSMIISASTYLISESVKAGFSAHLGIPDYLRIELAVAKILGSMALLLPFVPKEFKYFSYSGFVINLISAFIAHLALGDAMTDSIKPIIFLTVLVFSYSNYRRLGQGHPIVVH